MSLRRRNPFMTHATIDFEKSPAELIGAHKERAHSKFSASGSERWLNCAASVEMEEASPESPDTPWSKEGTLAHEVLEAILHGRPIPDNFDVTQEMVEHCKRVAVKVRALHRQHGGTLLIEKRAYAMFIHEEMFGTCDVIIAGQIRVLVIFDFKYGAGHVVQAADNTQLIQYALSVAESYDWERHFDFVELWIAQPRASKAGFKTWRITMKELKEYWAPIWHKGVARVERGGNKPTPGPWCHWCRANKTCPAKNARRVQAITNMFENNPLPSEDENGFEEKSDEENVGQKSEADWRKESKARKKGKSKKARGGLKAEDAVNEEIVEDFF